MIEEVAAQGASDLRDRCDRLIRRLRLLDGGSDLPATAIDDTVGYYHIVFGRDKSEIEKGIRLCQRAYLAKTQNLRQSERFKLLHERVGWRRFLRSKT